MRVPLNHLKYKSALHSFGWVFLFLVLFLLSHLTELTTAKYLIGGNLAGSLLRIVLIRSNYLISIKDYGETIYVEYFNGFLVKRQLVIDTTIFDATYISESNWLFGYTDKLVISSKTKCFTFEIIDKKVGENTKELLEYS